jgi:hypothetical protein
MTAPAEVLRLVEQFAMFRDEYKRGIYNETQVRQEYIDPFFEALGWDVYNRKGWAELYKDVIFEDSVKIGAATKAPDYGFRIGGQRKFFVEAKKPSVSIQDDVHPAFQVRRYAWSAKLPLSILTDFEEFAVYDCRQKPQKTDTAATARIKLLSFERYVDEWDWIAGIFSREAIATGAFDRFADSATAKRGTSEVDQAFLAEIERWRELLARNLALRNPGLGQRDLNFAVQRIIDRIIFLRIAEDRGVEPYGRLMALQNGGQTYERMVQFFQLADQRYNSGLFHFQHERGRSDEGLDTLTPGLTLDDKALKDILKNLYYPDSPYEFSVLPADILGQIYEQFLGKVIRLTAGHQAKVEEKPEVRKAGGVYYTPTYIVDYIVQQTVGKLVEGKSAGPQGAVSHLRVLDPACGSGSFLLGAYQYLLDWHLAQYMLDPQRWAKGKSPRLYQGAGGEWRLTTDERKRILLNNIYGVDIDPQAVEVTKLSLLLKVLEGESAESLATQLSMFQERVLPDLAGNIKCGNSLIGPDFYEGKQLALLDAEETQRVNAFDWGAEFPEIMRAGGFDAVIGNPPYIRIQTMKEWAPLEVEHYKQAYQSASKGNYDIYVVFVEKGLSLLNPRGRLGFILPHKFFNAQYGQPLREVLSAGKHLSHIVHFGDEQIFAHATTYTCLLFLEKEANEACHFVRVDDLAAWRAGGDATNGDVPLESIGEKEWNFVVGRGADLFQRLSEMPVKLGDVSDRIAQGIRTSANEVYVLNVSGLRNHLFHAHSDYLNTDVVIESEILSPFLLGRYIRPYHLIPTEKAVIIPYRVREGKAHLISERDLQSHFPSAYAYLRDCKPHLEQRERGRMRGSGWYGYVYPKNIDVMRTPKILVPDIADRASFALDQNGEFAYTSGYGIILLQRSNLSLEYSLALLNSRVLDFYLKGISTTMRGGFFRYFTQFVEQLPIRPIDFADPADVARHDQLVALVERMLALHQREARTPHDKALLRRQIERTDREIDRLVYELYDLTAAEIAIVEGG